MTRVVLHKRLVDGEAMQTARHYADGLAIDKSWRVFTSRSTSSKDNLIFDLSALDYLDHDSLLHLGAITRFRSLRGLDTLYDLPTVSHVLDFIRAWKFPEFISNVAGKPFEQLLTRRSKNVWKSLTTEFPRYVKVIDLPGGGMAELLSSTHFELTPISLTTNPFRAATVARDAWLERHFKAILEAYLGDTGERLGKMVILEAVLNAAMHPGAQMAYTSSQIVLPRVPDDSPRLQIGIWDDGSPIALTLQRRMDQGLPIVSPVFGFLHESFRVRLVRANGKEEVRHLNPRPDHIDRGFPWLSVIAFMAGVSSLPDRPLEETGQGLRDGDTDNYPGMGLKYIRRNVLDLWGGTIRYWVGSYRMLMKAGPERDTYQVDIFYRPKEAWPIQGNLLFLEIPLRRGMEEET
ncbi:hypothetical protein BN11_4940004 [Nostocoides australiense Ben110]|uniref:Uncharacterized protein n=1 Tax=Nostocoides australiense Ben110 TaxID=1193182 RepID=W6K4E8_9MICO|nr:hypothetical protein [Tetrasphaera australiensis]CCH74889.1 hypothetical protein BN11_4940004 [Tetrasphaera australiensis Ben110]